MGMSTESVTESLRFFIDTMLSFAVDDEGFVIKKSSGERLEYGTDGAKKHMVLYQETIPRGDFYILNPYAEALGPQSPPQLFFYKFLRMGMNARVRMLVLIALSQALISKGHTSIPNHIGIDLAEIPNTPELLSILSGNVAPKKPLIDEIDEKALDEIYRYTKTRAAADTMLDPVYKRTIPGTELCVKVIQDDDFLENIPGMRKVSAKILRQLLMNILGLKKPADLAKFTSKALPGAPVKMSSHLETFYKIYERINGALYDAMPEFAIDLGMMRNHLDNLAGYATNAKFMVISNTQPTATATPTVTAMPQNVIPSTVNTAPANVTVPSTKAALPTVKIPQVGGGYVEVVAGGAQAGYQPAQQHPIPQPYGNQQVAPMPVMGQNAVQPYAMGGMPTPAYGQGYGIPQMQPPQYYGGYAQAQPQAPQARVGVTSVFNPMTGQQQPAYMPTYSSPSAPGMPNGIY